SSVQSKPNEYLIIDEESNAVDYLVQSCEFLDKIEKNRLYIKWFIIAFHGAIYSFMMLALLKVNSAQIFRDKKNSKHPIDRDLLSFLQIYFLLKNKDNMGQNPFISTNYHDDCMQELNDELRNLMMHFRPMVWATEPWYPASVCYPLLDILKFCINQIQFRHSDNATLLAYINRVRDLLSKYKK
ncbi:hypothetical protein KKC08_00645, partial [Patescibacteria group bacterium]|nr:hypothetical protein [Patescibacteria group bacterium]